MGNGVAMYTQDYDETLPRASFGPAAPDPAQMGWGDCIYPYIKSEGAFDCPSGTQRCRLNTGVNPPRFWRSIGSRSPPVRALPAARARQQLKLPARRRKRPGRWGCRPTRRRRWPGAH
jgi:hypothetical protein